MWPGSKVFTAQTAISVAQAYAIDLKIDDGLPQSGNVLALYHNSYAVLWAAGGSAGAAGASGVGNSPTTAATPGSATTCFDNNSGSGPQQYSMEQNSGTGLNCALSFKFK
jgi:hypothetical protein